VNSPRQTPPPPLEANDQLVTGVLTGGWAIALIVLLILRDSLPANERWWVWTCVTGLGMGLFGLWYVPALKHRRAALALRRAERVSTGATQAAATQDSPEIDSAQTSPASGAAQVSRDSGSKTVSSTDTPGRSTRS
jgi:hypothetical protein